MLFRHFQDVVQVEVLFHYIIIGQSIVQGKAPTLFSFGLIHFLGYLFFLLMPVEALVPYYITIGHSPLLIGLFALVTALGAQVVDYAIGHALPKKTVEEMLGTKKYKKFRKLTRKYGNHVIFLFNLFPLSSPVIVLLAGLERLSFKETMKWCFWGLFFKYGVWIFLTYVFLGYFS